jgi:hypothetical protein
MTHKVQFFTGPVAVKELAGKAREAGLEVEEGTESLYIVSEGDCLSQAAYRVLKALESVHKTTFGLLARM